MYKTCSRCGKIHPFDYKCNVGRVYRGGEERKLRKTYAWQRKSEEIRRRSNYLCEVCRQEGVYNFQDVEVHHIIKVKDDESLLLDNLNLICLCKQHHRQADDNKIDIDYLKELAWLRENNIFDEQMDE